MRYLTEQEVIAIHLFIMEKYSPNEQSGVKSPELLQSAIHRPKQSAFGEDAYEGIFEKAGALFESLVGNHPFYNGNKRTAFVSLVQFLAYNGFRFRMDAKKAEDFVVDVVNHQYHFSEMVGVIEAHSKNTEG
ncbi:type II toxin-antitoxin system death-on-curing family toxin [Shouchella lonarensis]|uniref:Death on curing protein n=1 Tax=Shouchella lonarensis TaxID=1464122 RepID=A0A1G6LY29_9BACI|nr:type II toxin-antitoxin system death-on-curing family toxin [Shouchella lonarensis]SDC48173.1 death on curing protein [Shouchella lonarensis]